MDSGNEKGKKKTLVHSKGVIYFDGKAERAFFFILTILMLVWGLLAKIGLLSG